jgi:hypothetical protein
MFRPFARLTPLLLAFAAGPLGAQTTATTPALAVTPARAALAHDFLTAMHADSVFLRGIEAGLVEQRTAPGAPAPVFFDSLGAGLRRAMPDFLDSLSVIYAERFSDDDLRALAAFYHSPAGMHYANAEAEMTVRLTEVGRRLGMRVAADVFKRLADAGIDVTRH